MKDSSGTFDDGLWPPSLTRAEKNDEKDQAAKLFSPNHCLLKNRKALFAVTVIREIRKLQLFVIFSSEQITDYYFVAWSQCDYAGYHKYGSQSGENSRF